MIFPGTNRDVVAVLRPDNPKTVNWHRGLWGIGLLAVCVAVSFQEGESTSRVVQADEKDSRSGEGTSRDARQLLLEGLAREAKADDDARFEEAAELYWQSATLGDAQGMFEWANALMTGQGISQDEATAISWYQQSAEKGCAEAAMNLGWYFSRVPGDDESMSKARRWYEKAEALGFPSARYAIQALELDIKSRSSSEDDQPLQKYERILNLSVGKDSKVPDETRESTSTHSDNAETAEAIAVIRDAADSGDRNAMTDMGLLYSRGEFVDQDNEEAVRWWRRSAEKGDPWALHNLGWAHATGRGVERDLKAAFRSYFQAADRGNGRALWEVGLAYLEGRGTKPDEAAAAQCFRRAAEKRDPQAMAAMGQLYHNGSRAAGIDRDLDVACDWYLMATAHGEEHSEAAARTIANLPESSFSRALRGDLKPAQEAITKEDSKHGTAEERFAELERRADHNDVRAAILIGAAQLDGKGTERNPKAAFEVFRKYAATEPDARAYLSRCYAEGVGTVRDSNRAAELLESAANAGSPEAMYRMGRQSMRGFHSDPLEGLTWLQKAAVKGHAGAMYELGLAWKNGHGVPRDERQALAWFLQAGNSGSPEGSMEVAHAFEKGIQVPQSPAKALAWFREASRLGLKPGEVRADEIVRASDEVGKARASIALAEIREGHILTDDVRAASSNETQVDVIPTAPDGEPEFQLGKAYRAGRGVVQEPTLASFWLGRAVNKGHIEAHVELAELYIEGTGVPQDKQRGEELLTRAVAEHSAAGMYQLADLYYGRDARFRDRRKAMELFSSAAERGNIPAQRFLGKASRFGLATICDGGKAKHWWLRAAESGDVSSMLHLGELLEEGFGVPHDLEEAAHWYREAVDQNSDEAKTSLLRVQRQLRAASF